MVLEPAQHLPALSAISWEISSAAQHYALFAAVLFAAEMGTVVVLLSLKRIGARNIGNVRSS
jgi:hypothetical protein